MKMSAKGQGAGKLGGEKMILSSGPALSRFVAPCPQALKNMFSTSGAAINFDISPQSAQNETCAPSEPTSGQYEYTSMLEKSFFIVEMGLVDVYINRWRRIAI